MFDRLANRIGFGVSPGASSFLRRAAPVALGAVLFAAIGLAWPLGGSSIPPAFSSSPAIGADASADGGELVDFLAMARWGRPAYDPEAARLAEEAARLAAERAAAAGGINPKLAELGVIGISTTVDSRAVLLTKPGGDHERLTVGEMLPDGRTLVSVAANAVVLEDAAGGRESLLLFLRHGGIVVAGEVPADEEGAP
ncbi:MAG: hypothetical protein OXH68_00365 [Gammaproteobacteria bacterium]|nr:hypothetical protein [Gammaproteobacteria bacterium]